MTDSPTLAMDRAAARMREYADALDRGARQYHDLIGSTIDGIGGEPFAAAAERQAADARALRFCAEALPRLLPKMSSKDIRRLVGAA